MNMQKFYETLNAKETEKQKERELEFHVFDWWKEHEETLIALLENRYPGKNIPVDIVHTNPYFWWFISKEMPEKTDLHTILTKGGFLTLFDFIEQLRRVRLSGLVNMMVSREVLALTSIDWNTERYAELGRFLQIREASRGTRIDNAKYLFCLRFLPIWETLREEFLKWHGIPNETST